MKKTLSIVLSFVLILGMLAFAGCTPAAPSVAGTYTCVFPGAFGDETLAFELLEDGTCKFNLPGNEMIVDVYQGTYVVDGNNVTITGLTNVDPSSLYAIPGLWSFIDSTTGDCAIVIDPETMTFTAVEREGAEDDHPVIDGDMGDMGDMGGEGLSVVGTWTYTFSGPMGDDTMAIEFLEDGTCKMNLPNNGMITDVYVGTYVADGLSVTITGFTNADENAEHKTPGLWDFIDPATGDCAIDLHPLDHTFTPAE